MDLTQILAISGKGGLFKLVKQGRNGLIVEALKDKKRMPVYSTYQISSLEEISMYTYEEDIPLKDVFKKIFDLQNGERAIEHKSHVNELMAFFEKAIPDFDKERVYPSDVKKAIQWYNILHEHGMMVFDEESEETPTEETKEENAE